MAAKAELDKKYLKEEEHEKLPDGNKRYTICGMRFETTPKYAVRKAVGQGAYGLVCSGRNVETNKLVAIKKISKAFEDTVDCKRLLREIKILQHFKHDNVLGLLDILPPGKDGSKEWKDVYIVSELMDTDLHYIIHSKQQLTDEHFKYFLYQILRGVHAIHTAHVLHRDLKPGNLLVNKNCDLKICDFGLARGIDPSEEKKDIGLTEYVVTRWYRAPELLVENQSYTTAIDVWAVGCIFAEMLGRKALFPGRDYLHQLRLIIDHLGTPSEADLACITNRQAVQFLRTLPVKPRKPWADVFPSASTGALDLLNEMLVFDPAKRCTMVDALNSEYMAALHQGRTLPQEEEHFSFGFEKPDITQEELRDLIWEGACCGSGCGLPRIAADCRGLPRIAADDR
jgi:serine/threonine protein kinase